MPKQRAQSPMRIRLSDDRRATLLRSIKEHFAEHFDEPLSDFRAEALLEFFVRELGPPLYNRGVRDASSYMQSKLADIEGDVYETRGLDRHLNAHSVDDSNCDSTDTGDCSAGDAGCDSGGGGCD